MLSQLITNIFLVATAVNLFFWLYFISRLLWVREPAPENRSEAQPPVSIIICAHNEAANLEAHLDRILNQNYRSYEVLVVLHNSSDKSLDVLTSLQYRNTHLRIFECEDKRPGKKFALAKGIGQAKNNVLLLTDADCLPASDQWIAGMVAGMSGKIQIVLGFAPYEEAPGPLNKFIRYETCYTAMQYLSFSLAGRPYMGVGRNLAYRRELFYQVGGFEKHNELASGDDDLFINEVASKGNTGICLDPCTFVYSKSKTTIQSWYRQKRRHFSTGQEYKLQHKFLLSLFAMSHVLHYLGGIFIILKISIIFALLGYAVRMCVVWAFSGIILRRLQHQKLWPWVPALDACLVLYYVLFAPAILMNNDTQKWN